MPSERIRVLHIITRLIVGGAQENTLLTVEHLDRVRYEVTLASGPSTGPEGSLEQRIPPALAFEAIPDLVRPPDPRRDMRALARLYALMMRNRYHIVHTHTTKAGILGRCAARLAGVPVVVHTPHGHAFHGYLNRAGSGALTYVERWMSRWSDCIICLTDAERQDHLRLGVGSPEKFEIVPSGIELERFRAVREPAAQRRGLLGFSRRGPMVGCVARLVAVKGVEFLLEAVPKIRAAVPEVTVVFVGDGPLRGQLESRAQALGLDGGVVFLGLRDDVAELLPLFDVVVLPSLNEGMGRAAVEAMAAGRPVVGARVSGLRDVIDHEVSGLLVPPADAPAIADAVVRVLRTPGLARSLTEAAERALDAYSVEAMIGRIDALYVSLLKAKRGGTLEESRPTESRPAAMTSAR